MNPMMMKCRDCGCIDTRQRFEEAGSRRGTRHRCPRCSSDSWIVHDTKTFRIGQRVRFVGSFTCPPRSNFVAATVTNGSGRTIYILQDGGRFGAEELEDNS